MKPNLTQERLRNLLSYDPETGYFRSICRRKKIPLGAIVGSTNKHGYVAIGIDWRRYRAHHLAWFYVYNKWPDGELDHINGNPNDNRISNLREASSTENKRNALGRNSRKNRKSRFKGVSRTRDNKKWEARICVNYKCLRLGNYLTEEEASAAYEAKAKELFGEFYRPPSPIPP